ncbi:MAG: TatD family hydrolase [Prevotella sp.]|nr:TatD family hydrolase [Prevotella sp.]
MIDTHAHLDGPEYSDDRAEMIQRAKDAGVSKVFIPAIDLCSVQTVTDTCRQFPGYAYPMIGLHPEEVKADYREVLAQMKQQLADSLAANQTPPLGEVGRGPTPLGEAGRGLRFIAIGEVGLDYYWSREFEKEQLEAFEEQVRWSIATRLPLMIHCRKAQNEMVALLKKYADDLPGGVFHCFTGNEKEAQELLQFPRFVLGIGGVLTFKKSHLPEVLPQVVPLERIVLETDSPYMAPVPMRGKRNESAYVKFVQQRLAECYQTTEDYISEVTDANVARIFGI